MTPEEIKAVNKTCRSKGAVGKNALVPRLVEEFLKDKIQRLYYPVVIDFGAGKDLLHVKRLEKLFPDVLFAGYEVGDNATEDHVSRTQLIAASPFSLIYASNVLNVQPSMEALTETIEFLRLLAGNDGVVLANYPKPRKLELSFDDLLVFIKRYFRHVSVCSGNVITMKKDI